MNTAMDLVLDSQMDPVINCNITKNGGAWYRLKGGRRIDLNAAEFQKLQDLSDRFKLRTEIPESKIKNSFSKLNKAS